VPGIVNPTFRSDEPGDHLSFGVDRDRSFQEMFPDFAGSGRVVMTRISAGKPGRIDCSNRDRIVVGIEQTQSFPERVPEIQGFYPAEEFLKRGEMRHNGEIQFLLDRIHVSDIFNELPVVLVPVVFEEDQGKKLGLGIDPLRIFAGVRGNSYRFHDRSRCSDKPDIPAR